MAELNKQQKTEMIGFIKRYQELNGKITEIQKVMEDLQKQSADIIVEIDNLRTNEKSWVAKTAKSLGISEKDLANICFKNI
jgi:predicted transcriptional regulator